MSELKLSKDVVDQAPKVDTDLYLGEIADKLRPRGSFVVVEPLQKYQTRTKQGLIVPQAGSGGRKAQQQAFQLNIGRVKAVGPGHFTTDGTLIPLDLEAGDFVVWPLGAKVFPCDIQVGDKPAALLMDHENIICKFNDPEFEQRMADRERKSAKSPMLAS